MTPEEAFTKPINKKIIKCGIEVEYRGITFVSIVKMCEHFKVNKGDLSYRTNGKKMSIKDAMDELLAKKK